MKYKVVVYYDNMEDSEHVFQTKMKQSMNCTDWD